MRLVWANSPLLAADIIRMLEHSFAWNPKTIRTLINRLVKKGALGYEVMGKMYAYYPLVEEIDCLKVERRSFLHKIYGGALQPMLVHFLREEKMTTSDIQELRRILDEKEKDMRD